MANEKRLIDANKLEERVKIIDKPAWMVVRDAPTVDAVEVVRCKDCKHLNVLNRKDLYAHCPKTNTVFLPFELDTRTHYCSLGERKDNG